MIIRLHRWQPRAQRYRVQNFNLHSDEMRSPVWDLLLHRAIFERDATVDQIVARTQQVDRILINAVDNSIDVWMSPTIDRNYKRQAGKVQKARASDILCECRHRDTDHSTAGHINPANQICLIPGCRCQSFQRAGTRAEIAQKIFDDLVNENNPSPSDQ